jgi:PAS domain S-box-containing protein
MPLAEISPSPERRSDPGSLPQGGKFTGKGIILAVDDAPESLMMLTSTLIAEGYNVRPADSGELALASIATTKPELILLDIGMPGMDGFEVCRRLKSSGETRDIPVIFLSALTESKERVAGLKLGAIDYITKPFEKEELLVRIQTHLELSRLRNGLEEIIAERTANLNSANKRLRMELADRLRAEQALRESEQRFRTMSDHAPVVIWTSGPDAKIEFVNQYAVTLTGRAFDELTGEGWKEVMHPEDLEQQDRTRVPVVAAGREYRLEYRIRRADGEYRWMLETTTPRRLPDGSLAGYVGIAVDITDLKQNQEHLMAAQKLESLGVLVAGIAHNFNNLMGAIIAEADLALSEIPAGGPACGNIERINSVATRAADVVFMLTAYADARSTGAPARVDVSSVVSETLQLIRATASRNVRFCIDLAAKLPPVYADAAQIRQVVMNLLTNACESLPNREGSVCVNTAHVRLDSGDAAQIQTGLPEGDYVRLGVTDDGSGISPGIRAKIFDPFYTTKTIGRGLGLAAVQGIVRSAGGGIRIQSAPGQGSTFEVFLPSISEARSSAAELNIVR